MARTKKFQLTEENYYTPEANMHYMDCSTYKAIIGTPALKACELKAVKIAKGEYIKPKSTALLVGSYVDAYFEGTLPKMLLDNIESYYTKASIKKFYDGKGDLELLSEFKQAETMIKRAIKEPLFMKYMEGEKQLILTGEIAGVPIRVKLDSYDGNRITDLKTCASTTKTYYAADLGQRLNFIEAFGYVEQAAFYTRAVEQKYKKRVPFYIAAITKEKVENIPHPRVQIIQIPDELIDSKMLEIEEKIGKAWDVLHGKLEPIPCGSCEWCADNLPLTKVISMDELMLEV